MNNKILSISSELHVSITGLDFDFHSVFEEV